MKIENAKFPENELNALSINESYAEYSTTVTYGVTEEIYSFGGNSRKTYGIAVYADSQLDGTATVLAAFNDITSDKARLEELVQACNRSELSLIHLNDVIDDFLAN